MARIQIAALLFPGIDQLDLTGPFEVLSRLPDAEFKLYAKSLDPVRDMHGLVLTPDGVLSDPRQADLLLVPGGPGQEALMEDDAVLSWLRRQAAGARIVLSVCTGALLLGAAGLLRGVKATTHWAAFDVLPEFEAIATNERVVVDGKMVFAGGVTSGIDGAFCVAAMLSGEDVAQRIQLQMEYAPAPPFNSGSPHTAAEHVRRAVEESYAELRSRRLATARRLAKRK